MDQKNTKYIINDIYDNNNDDNDNNNHQINSQDILNAIDLNKLNQVEKKRRGRPRKKELMMISGNRVKSLNNKDTINLEEEEIILHLPFLKRI